MNKITINPKSELGKFKIMHAVNNGPVHNRHTNDQLLTNFKDYKAACIPYARNHDASFYSSYGGEHSNDITGIFPDFDADPYCEDSYDFVLTDEYILATKEAGTETFFRLGQKIEHNIKKYGTIPPKDFNKWAVICEHIIRHYNEGWANGYELNMQYWEIWNEPDLDNDDSTNKRTWGGTKAEFFDFYEIVAKHLKKCFPDLKIGGPACAGEVDWAGEFLCEMQKRNVTIDFFSWHIYCSTPDKIVRRAERMKEKMDMYGYGDAESILNEWNYVKGWEEEFVYSIKTIISMKGAAFTMAVMTLAQYSSIDMLMYYDARPCAFNGMFSMYTQEALKGYYPFLLFSKLYAMDSVIDSKTDVEDIYVLAGANKDGKTRTVITYYTDEENMPEKAVCVDCGKYAKYDVYLLDDEHNAELVDSTEKLNFTMKPNSVMMLVEK